MCYGVCINYLELRGNFVTALMLLCKKIVHYKYGKK